MSHERLKYLKDSLLCCVEAQMSHLEEVDAEELGEAIDMLKDLEEAIYYTTITEAMTDGEKSKKINHHEEEKMYYSSPMMYMDDGHTSPSHDVPHERDSREGRSPNSRRMYMEAKMMSTDKAMQLRELEKYMQELTTDVVEMIQDASPEEKSYLEKKMTTLATKIGQMK
jgi:hypothetical protein